MDHSENIYRIQALAGSQDWPSPAEYLTLIKSEAFAKAQERYLPFGELRRKNWAGPDLAKLWRTIKLARAHDNQPTPIQDKDGNAYQFCSGRHLEFEHHITRDFSGATLGIKDFAEGDKRQLIRRNLIEESIASSKLEGANTSREAARRMLQEGRKPRDHGERMIANNHEAMTLIEERLKNEKMSLDMIFDLHHIVTSQTLRSAAFEGKLRETFDGKGKRLVITPWDHTTVTYVAPDKDFVEAQLPRLIRFANDEDSSGFIHPLFKAIMLHFWIGLLHPFEDGNGRLARIIFYWYMLRKGYWAFAYLSLSERILRSPRQYAMAYIYSEQDDYDLNYFIQYNIEKLELARQDLQDYLKSKIEENRRNSNLLHGENALNARQFRLLQSLSEGDQQSTSVAAHHHANPDIGYVTAVTDLKDLVGRGLLKKAKTGRNVNYIPTGKLAALIK